MTELLRQGTVLQDIQTALATSLDCVVIVDDEAEDQELPDPMEAYVILDTIPGGLFWGSLEAPERDVDMTVQLSSVGRRGDQARLMADDAREVLLGRDATGNFAVDIPGVINRQSEGGPPGMETQGPPRERIYTVPERFVITVQGGG